MATSGLRQPAKASNGAPFVAPEHCNSISTRGSRSCSSCRRCCSVDNRRVAAQQGPHRPPGARQLRRPAAVSAPTAIAASDVDTHFDKSDWDSFIKGYKSQYWERSYWIDEDMVEGTIPAELEGTLLRNGPGLFEIGGKQIPQPFDGDGMLAIFAFKGGQAFFANRYVRTQGFVAEQQAQRMLYRGAFSVGSPEGGWFYNPFDLSVKGVANTGVVHWGGKLLALYERDLPYELSTPDLRTKGQTVQVPSQAPFFGAHYRIMQDGEGARRRLVAFNAAEVSQNNCINVLEYDEDLRMLHRTELFLPNAAFGFFHDFVCTENYYIFLENPMSLDLWKMATKYMLGKACIAECIAWDGGRKKTKIHLIPRPGSRAAQGMADPSSLRRVYETAPFFCFHHANAYEVELFTGGGSRLVIDTVANHDGVDLSANFDRGPTFYDDDVGRGTLTRLVIDPQTGGVTQHRLMDRACEFPSVSPAVVGQQHSHVYVAGSRFNTAEVWGAPAEAVCKVSLSPLSGVTEPLSKQSVVQDVYRPGRGQLAQEPIFVPRPGAEAEDDGWVLSVVFDSATERSKLVILDAKRLSAGPVATINLSHMLPLGLHGSWTGAYLGPQPSEPYTPTEYDIRSGVFADGAT